MITPVGLSLEASVAAMRAGIDGFAELPYRDNSEAPIIGAVVPVFDPELRPTARIPALLSYAAVEAAESLADHKDEAEEIALLLCLPEVDRPGVGVVDSRKLGTVFENALGRRIDRRNSRIITNGHVGAFEALRHARAMLAEGLRSCLIFAADSLIGARSLLWLEQHHRLLCEANSDGVVPGEAAAVIHLSGRSLDSVAIVGVGFGEEEATPLNDHPVTGAGLAEALNEALDEAGKTLDEIDLRLSDVAGEGWAFEELVLGQQRVMRRVRSEQPLWHPADKVGDTGAASGLIQLIVGRSMISSPDSRMRSAICQASAKSGRRAACVVVSSLPDEPR
jgi:3-oxoacyl-[acyl-carrier-protein] synthase I